MASAIFTDCSSSTAALTRFRPLRRDRIDDRVLDSRRSVPLQFAPTKNHSLLRTVAATTGHASASPSVRIGTSPSRSLQILYVIVYLFSLMKLEFS
ncbi:hypothetical protein U1Q18_046923 [Sarracenia purpurea var. burkii]